MSYMFIDVTALAETAIVMVRQDTYGAAIIAKLYKAKGRELIAPQLEGRGFSKLTLKQLQYLYWNMTQQVPPTEYSELVQKLVEVAKTIKVDETPLTTLEAEYRRVFPDEAMPSNGAAKTAKADKPPREPRAPGAAPERPKATSTTGLVWELADKQFAILHPSGDASTADWKIIRAGVMDACKAEGINSATAATQYSKWKAAKLVQTAA